MPITHAAEKIRRISAKKQDYNYADLLKYFIPQLIQRCNTQNIVLLGHSLGGHLASLYALENGTPIVVVASGNIHYKNWDFKGRAKILGAALLFKTMVRAYGFFPGYKVGFGDREAKGLMNNWCHTVFTGNYGFVDVTHRHHQVNNLFIHIKDDPFSPLKSTKNLAEMFNEPILRQIELSPTLTGNKHSIWLKDPYKIIQTIDHHLKTWD